MLKKHKKIGKQCLPAEQSKSRLVLCIPVYSSQAVEKRRLMVEASEGGQCAPRVTHDPRLAFRFLLRTANVDPDRHFPKPQADIQVP